MTGGAAAADAGSEVGGGLEAGDAVGAVSKTRGPRLLAVDALRGIAVLLMIEQHLGAWLWKVPEGHKVWDFPGLVAINALGGGAAPAFITVAGVGAALFVPTRRRPDRTMVIRGLLVMGFGLLLNLMAPNWFSWRSWFVLHLMGFGMATTPLWRRLSSRALLVTTGAILLTTPMLLAALDTPGYLPGRRMAGFSGAFGGEAMPWAVWRLALAEGQFPIFPWLSFYLLGMVAGRALLDGRQSAIVRLGFASLAAGGLGLALFAAGVPGIVELPRYFKFNVPFFPATPAFVVAIGGLVLLTLAAFLAFERRYTMSPRGPLVVLGRASLTLLLSHVVLFREGGMAFGFWKSFGAGQTLVILAAVFFAAVVLCRAWERVGYAFGAEWVLRRLTPRDS
ncbi:MAG: DUF418 domain-containing transporter [Myxococcota bacterium]